MFNILMRPLYTSIKKLSNELYWRNEGAKMRRKAEIKLSKFPKPTYQPPNPKQY